MASIRLIAIPVCDRQTNVRTDRRNFIFHW